DLDLLSHRRACRERERARDDQSLEHGSSPWTDDAVPAAVFTGFRPRQECPWHLLRTPKSLFYREPAMGAKASQVCRGADRLPRLHPERLEAPAAPSCAKHETQPYRGLSPRTIGWPMPSGLASTSTKAARATSLPRLTQAWLVPRWTIPSPALGFTVESSMSISSSPCITIT